MSAGGYQTPAGSGNGASPSLNDVRQSDLWRKCRAEIELAYPWLIGERVFDGIERAMIVYDVEETARHLSSDTWLMTTPDDYFPVLSIYFTYTRDDAAAPEHGPVRGKIVLQAVHADEF